MPIKTPPNKADIWTKCHASMQMSQKADKIHGISSYRSDGIESHKIAADMIDAGLRACLSDNPLSYVTQYNTLEIVESAYTYAKDVLATAQTLRVFGGPSIGTEYPVFCSPHIEGVCDQYIYSDKDKRLIIWEYKYGHAPVYPEKNPALICYAYGVGRDLDLPPHTEVALRVIQPRCYANVKRRQIITLYEDICEQMDAIITASEKAQNDPCDFCPGFHCRYCEGRYNCDAFKNNGYSIMDSILDFVDPIEWSNDALSIELRHLDDALTILKYRIESVKSQIENRLLSGQIVPYYRITDKESALKWTVSQEEICDIAMAYGIDISKNDVLTPKQAMDKGLPEDIVTLVSERKSKPVLERLDNEMSSRVFLKRGK